MNDSTAPHDVLGDDPESANEEVAKLRLQLKEFSLPELVNKGLVEWNKDEHLVTKGPQFDKERLDEFE